VQNRSRRLHFHPMRTKRWHCWISLHRNKPAKRIVQQMSALELFTRTYALRGSVFVQFLRCNLRARIECASGCANLVERNLVASELYPRCLRTCKSYLLSEHCFPVMRECFDVCNALPPLLTSPPPSLSAGTLETERPGQTRTCVISACLCDASPTHILSRGPPARVV